MSDDPLWKQRSWTPSCNRHVSVCETHSSDGSCITMIMCVINASIKCMESDTYTTSLHMEFENNYVGSECLILVCGK